MCLSIYKKTKCGLTTDFKTMYINRNEQLLILNGVSTDLAKLNEIVASKSGEEKLFFNDLYLFLEEWFNDSPTISVQTSGSTGLPKKIIVSKENMIQSAIATCRFLGLKEGDKALLCLPTQYIAGKMMIVRTLVCRLNLYAVVPSGHPLQNIDQAIDFAAMIPAQVYNSINTPLENKRLGKIKQLIIGGSGISKELENLLHEYSNNVFSTYGMTETLSHIALRRINGKKYEHSYTPLPNIKVWLDKDSTLIIDASQICSNILHTNDIAQIHKDGTFTVIGRKDNTINSGGVKIQIEQVEEILSEYIKEPFIVSSIPHSKWGEEVVLLIESQNGDAEQYKELIKHLPKFWQPHHIVFTKKIPLTNNNKIDRSQSKLLLRDILPI